jgi:calcineurin-like phosphoesterase family protein
MDVAMIKNLQGKVAQHDTLFVLGDFSFYRPERTSGILAQIPGKKILIKGNHDHSKNLKKVVGWELVVPYYELNQDKQLIIMSHYPFATWRNAHHGSWHLHGHCHGNLRLQEGGKRLDVGVDCHDFMPLDMRGIAKIMEKKKFVVVDHHEEREK